MLDYRWVASAGVGHRCRVVKAEKSSSSGCGRQPAAMRQECDSRSLPEVRQQQQGKIAEMPAGVRSTRCHQLVVELHNKHPGVKDHPKKKRQWKKNTTPQTQKHRHDHRDKQAGVRALHLGPEPEAGGSARARLASARGRSAAHVGGTPAVIPCNPAQPLFPVTQ